MRGGLGLSALSFLGLAGCGSSSSAVTTPAKALNFTVTALNQAFDGVSVKAARTVVDEVPKDVRLSGVSVVEGNKVNAAFQVNLASNFKRRVTTLADMDISGPLRGDDLLKTKYSPTGTKTRDSLKNFALGATPHRAPL